MTKHSLAQSTTWNGSSSPADSDVLLSLQDHDPLWQLDPQDMGKRCWRRRLRRGQARGIRWANTNPTSAETEGPSIAVNRYKASEEPNGFQEWRSERQFPVPPGVDPTGRVYMDSHISIALSGQPHRVSTSTTPPERRSHHVDTSDPT